MKVLTKIKEMALKLGDDKIYCTDKLHDILKKKDWFDYYGQGESFYVYGDKYIYIVEEYDGKNTMYVIPRVVPSDALPFTL